MITAQVFCVVVRTVCVMEREKISRLKMSRYAVKVKGRNCARIESVVSGFLPSVIISVASIYQF